MNKATIVLLMGLLAWSAALSTACAQDVNDSEASAEAEQVAQDMAEEIAGETAEKVEASAAEVETAATEEEVSAVMMETMDGSSVEAFEKALKNVEENATSQEFLKLRGAVEWLSTYDLRYRTNKEALYLSMDGKTPTEIIERAARR